MTKVRFLANHADPQRAISAGEVVEMDPTTARRMAAGGQGHRLGYPEDGEQAPRALQREGAASRLRGRIDDPEVEQAATRVDDLETQLQEREASVAEVQQQARAAQRRADAAREAAIEAGARARLGQVDAREVERAQKAEERAQKDAVEAAKAVEIVEVELAMLEADWHEARQRHAQLAYEHLAGQLPELLGRLSGQLADLHETAGQVAGIYDLLAQGELNAPFDNPAGRLWRFLAGNAMYDAAGDGEVGRIAAGLQTADVELDDRLAALAPSTNGHRRRKGH